MGEGTLIGYFTKQNEARNALRKLNQQGYKQAILAYKAANGAIRTAEPTFWRRLFRLTLSSLPWFKRFVSGVKPEVVQHHARLLIAGESVLIFQAPVAMLQHPMALLRESSDPPPALFVMHPKCERRIETRDTSIKLTPAQVLEHARRHALEQRVELKPQHTQPLLKRLKRSRQWVRQVCVDLSAASRMEQKATPAADWILDNEYILEGNFRDVLLNLPRRFYRQLPTLASDPNRGLPCIYGLAKDLVSHTELSLDRETVVAFIEAHQSVRKLTISELWALPQMMRIALIESIQNLAVTALADLRERQLADFWANRLIAANRRDSNQLFSILAELAKSEPSPSHYFGAQLVGLLYDEAAALAPVQSWLERTLKIQLHDLTLREQTRQTKEQLFCGNAFTSLRQLALLDWREVFEKLNGVEQLFRHDPSGVYPGMDFATRDRCRRAVEELARAAGQSEEAVAGLVIKLATQADRDTSGNHQRRYIGNWLTGEGRTELVRLLACDETVRYRTMVWIYGHHTAVYGFGIVGFTALFLYLISAFVPITLALPVRLGLLLLLLIPVSQLAIEVVNYLITRFLPPRSLPKMDFEVSGIPDAFRTLVVVPMMLVNAKTVHAEVEKLEIRYLANKEANLLFSLFTDYTDAITLSREDDSRLLQLAQQTLEELNQRHGANRFLLFHRERTWSDSEQKFIGWERKRGKLEELNRLIDGTRPENAQQLIYVGALNQLEDVRFIITLDSDTQIAPRFGPQDDRNPGAPTESAPF